MGVGGLAVLMALLAVWRMIESPVPQRIWCLEPTYSAGVFDLLKTSEFHHDFIIKNDFDRPIALKGVHTTCHCTTAQIPKMVQPHSKVAIPVRVIPSPGSWGPYHAQIIVSFDDESLKPIIMDMKAMIDGGFKIDPSSIDLGEIKRGQERTVALRVLCSKSLVRNPFQAILKMANEEAQASTELVGGKEETLSRGKDGEFGYYVKVFQLHIHPEKEGENHIDLSVESNASGFEKQSVPLDFFVPHARRFNPDHVFMGYLDKKESASQWCSFECDEGFKISNVKVTGEGYVVKSRLIADGKILFNVGFSGASHPGQYSGALELKSSDGNQYVAELSADIQ